MPSFFSKIKGAFSSPSPSRKGNKNNADLNDLPQIYHIKEKELSKLHLAAWKGDMERVIELCRPDKINSVDKDGRAPLHLAVAANQIKVVDHLLSEDARLDIIDSERRTPMIIACIKCNPPMLELLIQHNRKPNIINQADQSGLNPLLYAIKNENIEVLKLLLNCKDLNIDFQDKDKNTAFHYAVIQRQHQLIDILIENGADIDKQNADGRTPLMLAAKNGDEELVDYLLDFNPNRGLKDNLGHTAQDYAELSDNPKCKNMFTEHRPVKANATLMYKNKRKTLDNEKPGNSLSEANKKFENLFAVKKEESSDKNDVSSKYKVTKDQDADSNTSKIMTYNKSDKIDTWGNSDSDSDEDEESDDQIENEEGLSNLKNIMHESYGLFGKADFTNSKELDSNIEININEDKIYGNSNWLFQSKNEKSSVSESSGNEFQVMKSFLPNAKSNLSKQDSNASKSFNWTIYIYTSRVKGAGTDASVYMQIFGSKSNTTQFFLDDNKNSKKLFETGNCDRFDRNFNEIGKPLKIKIGHDNKGLFAGWHLEKVVLQNNITDEKYVFHCNRWLAKDEGDHKIEVELTLESNKKSLSISSWTSDEDDSLSLNNKLSPVKQGILLKQIDEEKGNETILSKKDNQNPPEISDFESSDDEKFNPKQLNSTKKSDQLSFNLTNVTPFQTLDNNGSAISFLIKNNLPKQSSLVSNSSSHNETIGNLVSNTSVSKKSDWKNSNFSTKIEDNENEKKKSKEELNSSIKFLLENNLVPEPVNDLDSISFDELVEEFEQNSKPKQKIEPKSLIELMHEEKRQSSAFHQKKNEPMGLVELMREEKLKQKSVNEFLVDDLSFNDDPQDPKELIKYQNKSNTGNLIFGTPPKSETKGLKELMREEQLSQKSIDFSDNAFGSPRKETKENLSQLIKEQNSLKQGNLIFGTPPKSETKGLKELMREEQLSQKSIDFSDNVFGSPIKPGKENLSQLIKEQNSQNQGNLIFGTPPKSETKGLREIIRDVKNINRADSLKSDVFEDFSSPRHKTDPKSDAFSELEKQFNDIVSPKPVKYLVQNSIPPPGFRNEYDKNQISSIDSLSSEQNSPKRNIKVNFEDSDDEIENFVSPKKTSGIINQGIGTFIGSFKDSPLPSPKKSSFYDIVPEMLNVNSNDWEKLKKKNEELENQNLKLEAQLNEIESEKKKYSTGFNNLTRELAEKEKLIAQMTAEKFKNSLTNSLDLNREIEKLKEEKMHLEKQILEKKSFRGSEDFELVSKNESLMVKIKALEHQIDELNKDRNILNNYKEELIQKLDEQENDIRKHNEALQIVTLQFNVEKKSLNDEIAKNKRELSDLNDLKKNLELLIENLKKELSEKNLNYEKIIVEKTSFEKQIQKLGDDAAKNRSYYETELNKLKDEKFSLLERLAVAEAKLINTEKDAKYTSNQIDERYKQIDDLKEQLVKSRAEYTIQLNLLQKEKEEKDVLVKKLNETENQIKKHLQEISDLKLQNLTQLQELKDKNESINSKIENENKKLQNDIKSLSDKLFKTETELEKLKLLNQQREQSYDENESPDGNETIKSNKKINFNEKIHSELQKLREDFTTMINKYSSLETSNHELNESINSLKNITGANKNDMVLRRDPIDVSAMITEVPLKTLTTLNSYLLQNLIQSKEDQSEAGIQSKSGENLGQSNKFDHSQFITSYSIKSNNYPKFSTSMNGLNSYADILKYELSKRIELQVAKELSLSGGFSSIKVKKQTDNVDSLYSTMKTNTRYPTEFYSNSNNSDLLTSLRSKFLI